MSARNEGKGTVVELASEDMRHLMAWEKLVEKYGSGNTLYRTLRLFYPEFGPTYERDRIKLGELQSKISAASDQLSKLEGKISEGEANRQTLDLGLIELSQMKAAAEEEINDLSTKRESLTSEVASLREEMRKATEDAGATDTLLAEFVKLKNEFEKYDFELGDLNKVSSVLLSLSRLNFDPTKVIEVFTRISDHESEVKRLQQAAESQQRTVDELDEKAKTLNDVIAENEPLVREIRIMRESKLEASDVKAVVDAAVRIGGENGLSERDAISKIESDLQLNWNAKLGLEYELKRLQEVKRRVSEDITDLREEHEKMKLTVEANRKKLEAINDFRRLGIDGNKLIVWSEALASSGCNLSTFVAEMTRLGGLKASLLPRRPKHQPG